MTRTLVLTLLVLGIAPLVAQAGMLTYSVQYETTFADATTAWVTGAGIGNKSATFGTGSYNPNWVHRMAIYINASGFTAGQDFAALGMDLTLSSGLQLARGFNNPAVKYYQAYNPQVVLPMVGLPFLLADSTGLYSSNKDGGANLDDAQGIIAEMTAPVAWGLQNANLNPGSTLGGAPLTSPSGPEYAPLKVGYIFVKWNGTSEATVTASGAPAGGNTYSCYLNNADGTDGAVVPIAGSVTNGVYTFTPEPATMALLVLGGLGLISRRRRA